MAYFKEIVTKAVIGKGKKATTQKCTVTPSEIPNTVLGCWIINHNFSGVRSGKDILVNGSFDVNVWYSYDNDTKTTVSTSTYNYSDKMNIPINKDATLTNNSEIIVNCLSDPNVTDVNANGNSIEFTVRKEMGIELVGDTKMRVSVEDNYDDYTVIMDEEISDNIFKEIDEEVKENYIEENISSLDEKED